jgi:hypothetical protein
MYGLVASLPHSLTCHPPWIRRPNPNCEGFDYKQDHRDILTLYGTITILTVGGRAKNPLSTLGKMPTCDVFTLSKSDSFVLSAPLNAYRLRRPQ